MFLRSALNALTRIHSRVATIKRLGTVDIYSPCRITPANYFRFLNGPEHTTIKGSEFIIPIDTITGQYAQKVSFSAIPDSGQFKLTFGSFSTGFINYNATAADIQTALRLISSLENVLVTGSFMIGFTITFVGFAVSTGTGQVTSNTLEEGIDAVTDSWQHTSTPWTLPLKKGDRIISGNQQWSIDEVIDMFDLGAEPMAYRCRCD